MDNDDWKRLYRLLADTGLPQPTVPIKLGKGKHANAELALGWPDLKVGIGFDSHDPAPFERDNWTVVRLSGQLSHQLPAALKFLDTLLFAVTLHQAELAAEQNTSKTERRLLEGLLHAGLPQPDRNHEVRADDGSVETVPDFAWPDRKLAVFVDGSFYHGGRDLVELAQKASDSSSRRSAISDRWRNRSAADAEKRRRMTVNGWTVIAISDRDIDGGGDGLQAAVDDVASAWRNAAA